MTDDSADVRAFELLERLGAVLRSEQRRLATEAGLKLVQLEALQFLARANRYSDTPVAVADALALTKGTVSQTLSALEAKSLIEKRADPGDGRVSHCVLTRRGRKLVERSVPPERLRSATERLDETELNDQLEQLLGALIRAGDGRTFGVCHTCRHFVREGDDRYRCGLTGERLLPAETLLRCREHEHAA